MANNITCQSTMPKALLACKYDGNTCTQGTSYEMEQLRAEAAATNAEVVQLGDALATKEDELAQAQAHAQGLAQQLQAAQAEAARLAQAHPPKCALPTPCPELWVNPRTCSDSTNMKSSRTLLMWVGWLREQGRRC